MNFKSFLILALLLYSVCSFGQFGTENTVIDCKTCVTFDILDFDVDSDNDKDIITAAGNIFWYEHDGQGNFELMKNIVPSIKNATDISLMRVDDDDKVDLLVRIFIKIGDSKLIWLKNEGDGQFSEQGTLLEDVLFFDGSNDLDNDGDDDLVAVRYSKVVVLENIGAGNFIEKQIISSEPNFAYAMSTADLDKDGDVDVIFSVIDLESWSEGIAWIENDGAANFSEPQMIAENLASELFFHTGDLNGDGFIDVIIADPNKQKLSWIANKGGGMWEEPQLIIENQDNVGLIRIADIDTDGDNDIISSGTNYALLSGGSATTRILTGYLNDGNGNFPYSTEISNDVSSVQDMLVLDMDTDGDVDLIYAKLRGELTSLKNNRRGGFTDKTIAKNPKNHKNTFVLDLNGDQHDDIISTIGERIVWFSGDGTGNFSDFKIVDAATTAVYDIYPTDLDLDGDTDILASSGDETMLLWYENVGTSTFLSAKIISSTANGIKDMYSLDLDADGDMDILTLYAYDNKLVWLENKGQQNFTEHLISEVADRSLEFTISDLNGNGLVDILVNSIELDNITLFINEGNGNFKEHQNSGSSLNSVRGIFTADLDGDSANDLLTKSRTDGKLRWYKNDGIGNFTLATTFPDVNRLSNPIYAADIDGDDDIDVITHLREDNIVVWYENDGNGIFGPYQRIAKSYDANTYSGSDLDGDRDIDFLVGAGSEIVWYENFIDHPAISGVVFWDENQNGLQDNMEQPIRNIPIIVSPNALSSYTTSDGVFQFFVPDGDYVVSTNPNLCWGLTTDSTSYHVTVGDNLTARDNNFGFERISSYQHTQVRINSSPTRCGFDVNYTISVENDGCIAASGTIGLLVDSLVTVLSESEYTSGDTLYWVYDNLLPSESRTFSLGTRMPGPEHIGEFIKLTAFSFIESENGVSNLSSSKQYHSEIRCAYDPNDKLVTPDRTANYDQNYTLFEEPLEYTIRFQNTGNDTAFNVVIRDTLDKNLDWTTFKPILASHNFETLLSDKNGLIEFSFKNILLPDSTTNEPLSHGFVTYKIKPQKGLSENTAIENTAYIYFDFNPPIVTNTTSNVLVSELPKTTSIQHFNSVHKIKVFPNPFENYLTIEQVDVSFSELPSFQLFDATGRLIQTVILQNITKQISTNSLEKGLYFYQITNSDGLMLTSGKVIKQ